MSSTGYDGFFLIHCYVFLLQAFEHGATSMINMKFRNILPLSSLTPLKLEISLNGPYWSVKSLDDDNKVDYSLIAANTSNLYCCSSSIERTALC